MPLYTARLHAHLVYMDLILSCLVQRLAGCALSGTLPHQMELWFVTMQWSRQLQWAKSMRWLFHSQFGLWV